MDIFLIVFEAIGFFLAGVFLTLEFSKDKDETDRIYIDNECFLVNPKVSNRIRNLEKGMDYYESLSNGYEEELKSIRPILEVPGVKPAVSLYCDHCEFVLRSPHSHEIIGCKKDVVCNDYKEASYAKR